VIDVIDYVLRCVLSNELFMEIILLLLVQLARYQMMTKFAFKRYMQRTLDTDSKIGFNVPLNTLDTKLLLQFPTKMS